MITLTKDLNKAKFVTHAGNFHADDVFSTVFMSKLFGDITVIRLKDYDDNDTSKISYDIGRGRFDHHQAGYDKKHDNGIHYCGFGLLWQEYGIEYLKKLNINSLVEKESVAKTLKDNNIDYQGYIDKIANKISTGIYDHLFLEEEKREEVKRL